MADKAKTLAEYLVERDKLVAFKPDDAPLSNNSAVISSDGVISISFASSDVLTLKKSQL